MNLIKAHKKQISRNKKNKLKKSLDFSKKTGRMKVVKRLQKEHQKKILEEKLKVDINASTTSIPNETTSTSA